MACYSSITLIGLQKKVIETLDEATTTRSSKSALNTFHTVSNTKKDKDTYTVSDQLSALSLVGSKVLVCTLPCLFLWDPVYESKPPRIKVLH